MAAPTARPVEQHPPFARQLCTFFLPVTEVIIQSPLSLDHARQRLTDALHRGLEHTSGSGILRDQRRYQGQLTDDRLRLRGPYGYKKWALTTRGTLSADPTGSVLALKMQLDNGYALFALSLFLPFAGFLGLLFSRAGIVATCAFLPAIVIYGAILVSVKVEAETIKDLLVTILSPDLFSESRPALRPNPPM